MSDKEYIEEFERLIALLKRRCAKRQVPTGAEGETRTEYFMTTVMMPNVGYMHPTDFIKELWETGKTVDLETMRIIEEPVPEEAQNVQDDRTSDADNWQETTPDPLGDIISGQGHGKDLGDVAQEPITDDPVTPTIDKMVYATINQDGEPHLLCTECIDDDDTIQYPEPDSNCEDCGHHPLARDEIFPEPDEDVEKDEAPTAPEEQEAETIPEEPEEISEPVWTQKELESFGYRDLQKIAGKDPLVPGNLNREELVSQLKGRPKNFD